MSKSPSIKLGPHGPAVIAGSGCMWAWVDSLFMGTFFQAQESVAASNMAETSTTVIYLISTLAFLLVILCGETRVHTVLSSRKLPVCLAACGTVGSVLFVLAGIGGSTALLMTGCLLCGLFMAGFPLSWGALYAMQGAQKATPYVTGGFAAAALIDTPLLFMAPVAAQVFTAVLPLVSAALLLTIPNGDRMFTDPDEQYARKRTARARRKSDGLRLPYLTEYLAVSVSLAIGIALVKAGYGYAQHLTSFGASNPFSLSSGALIQMVRGVAALLLFALFMLSPSHSSVVYRGGLLVMVAGFMAMPFTVESDWLWAAGAVVVFGYAALDVMRWVVFSQIAYSHSRAPLKTIAFGCLLTNVAPSLGLMLGWAVPELPGPFGTSPWAAMVVAAYLVVIATVILLGSQDVWRLFGWQRDYEGGAAAPQPESAMQPRLDAMGLTEREKEVAGLLVQGRSQPWIAKSLGISENTVGTHVRRIYQKVGVNGRQELIDAIIPAQGASRDSRDR